ncbi:hypothetical protein N7532_008279 [Penicillium argentinense]|uniref:Uncharacterized protein n=1 Tax=Penicillium argentinense TaxID=1131581 RepID=A0A9W9K1Q4_9EURO|nr:uncharacterized protein N7532_008279 [Penicillium argentinense]KAJ5089595.1 hypothetical protein N7532_008279 [Penicillium argentinense]
MLLNLGLTADAAAAHPLDSTSRPDTPPTVNSPYYTAAFSLPTLPLLGHFYPKLPQPDAPTTGSATASGSGHPAGSVSGPAMSPVATSGEGESSQAPPPTLTRPRVSSNTNRKLTRPKTSYQLAHPAAHARHKRLKLRPRLLLQLQQVSQTPRPLPILDVLPSTLYLPRLARRFPALFRGRNGLGPNDLIIVMSELYERTVSSIPEKQPSVEGEDEDHREVVATICQMLQEDARLKGKAEICLNFGPVWEATPLPSGSYEFVARTDNGLRIMRWALRAGKSRRVSSVAPGTPSRDDGKRFTFSVIDPHTRRHPVIASLTRNHLEVFDEYSAIARSSTGPTTPTSAMSVVSDMSDTEAPLESSDVVTVDDGLRTLIITTGIWVAFREGWSHNFSYGDPVSAPNGKSLVSPTSSKTASPTVTKAESSALVDRDDLSPMEEVTNGVNGKRCASVSSVRRSNTMAPAPSEGGKSFGSLSKRSNSTGAAFIERAKQRTSSGISNRLNRHSMFTATGENGREIVVSRPPSLRQNSNEPEDVPTQPGQYKKKIKAQLAPETSKPSPSPDGFVDRAPAGPCQPLTVNGKDHDAAKTKRRHRFSSLFAIFHRKQGTH